MTELRIDIDRLTDRLAALAEIGAIEGTEGCARLALTDEDKAGRDLVVTWMRDLGMRDHGRRDRQRDRRPGAAPRPMGHWRRS